MKVELKEVKRLTPRRAARFAASLRETDAREVLGASGVSRKELPRHIIDNINETVVKDGRVWMVASGSRALAIFGARLDSLTADSAGVWMLATDEAALHPLAFARWSRRCLKEVFRAIPQATAFYNYAPPSGASAEWLRWLGAWFSTREQFRSPWTGETYTKFIIETGGDYV